MKAIQLCKIRRMTSIPIRLRGVSDICREQSVHLCLCVCLFVTLFVCCKLLKRMVMVHVVVGMLMVKGISVSSPN